MPEGNFCIKNGTSAFLPNLFTHYEAEKIKNSLIPISYKDQTGQSSFLTAEQFHIRTCLGRSNVAFLLFYTVCVIKIHLTILYLMNDYSMHAPKIWSNI